MKRTSKLSTLFGLALTISTFVINAAEAKDHFVSKNGSNADGDTWASAWNELSQINWSQIQPGDNIYLDGGPKGASMTYNTSLVVKKSGSTPDYSIDTRNWIAFGPGKEPEHAGTIVIDGQNRAGFSAIVLNKKGSFSLSSIVTSPSIRRDNWLKVTNCDYGLYVKNGTHCYFDGLELVHNKVAAYLNGKAVILRGSDIHDNDRAVVIHNSEDLAVSHGSGLKHCWLYNRSGQSAGNGVLVSQDNTFVPTPSQYAVRPLSISDSVLGPNLSASLSSNYNNLSVSGSLFLQPLNTHLQLTNKAAVGNCTFFTTAKNSNGQTVKALVATKGSSNTVASSIFYGGTVNVPSGTSYGPKNTQFATTGNVTAISASMQDPLFVSAVGGYPNNVSFATLKNSDFALQSASPAKGTGAYVTSVRVLLNSRK